MASIVCRTLLTPLGLIVPSLGGTAGLTAAPAEAQHTRDYDEEDEYDRPRRQRRFEQRFVDDDDFDRLRVERRMIEWRFVRPAIERRVIVRPAFERRFVRPVVEDCRLIVTKRISRFGEREVVRRRICD